MGIRGSGGGSTYQPVYQLPASAMATPETNGAPLARNLDIPVRLFDDTTTEKVRGSFWLPDNFDASGEVVITAAVEPVTPAAANVLYGLSWKAIGSGGNISSPWSSQAAVRPPQTVDATANKIFFHEEIYTSLSWSPADLIIFEYGRKPAAENNLSGDLRMYHLTIKVPVS